MSNFETHFEWRVAYISDGAIEELFDQTEEEADEWIALVNEGRVIGVEPGDCFKQFRRVNTSRGSWKSVLDDA